MNKSFKDFLADDISTFINTNEFAETREFMGVTIDIVESASGTDEAKLSKKIDLMLDGVFTSFKRINFAVSDLEKHNMQLPREGDLVTYENITYQVASSSNPAGIATIELVLTSDGV